MTLFLEILAAIVYTYLVFIVGANAGAQVVIDELTKGRK